MLVVSRKQNQQVLFPYLGISVQILRIAGNAVRVGIDAPEEIKIVRGELMPDGLPVDVSVSSQASHRLRNQLNAAKLAMHLLQKQIDLGMFNEADDSLNEALRAIDKLDQLASGAEGESKQTDGVTSRRALIVEDNNNERELLAGYLRLCGYEVETVEDGAAAIQHLDRSSHLPSLILMDMHMPRLNGAETLKMIRSNPRYRGIKIFAVTGANKETHSDKKNIEFDEWFQKPIQPAEFAARLDDKLACAVA